VTTATIPPPTHSTAHPDRAAMLRTILEHPEADEPRLIFADWLDDHGEHPSAAFIRRQMNGEAVAPPLTVVNRIDDEVLGCQPHQCFRSGGKEHALSNRALGWVIRKPSEDRQFLFRRGLLDEVKMPCAAFMANAASLFAAHPVTRVVLVDKRPYAESWFRESAGLTHPSDPASDLPDELFALTKPEFQTYCGFRSESAANDALSAACVSYGRSLAGLQPLPQPITQPCEH
jgi:uncharacterized protein (TIGR02996 family)